MEKCPEKLEFEKAIRGRCAVRDPGNWNYGCSPLSLRRLEIGGK